MAKSYDPIAPVAEEISKEAALLCFDEFQVRSLRLLLHFKGNFIKLLLILKYDTSYC